MKRMVGIVIIAVFTCALFLVPISAARVGISCSVYPEEGDYRSKFTYTITITNPYGSEISGEGSLIVGSNYYSDLNISKKWNLTEMETSCKIKGDSVIIPAEGYCTFNKSVKHFFKDRELYKGGFKAWAENSESPAEWEEAWYKCCFTKTWGWPPEPPVCSGEHGGKPVLTNNIIKFYESSWKYNKTGCPDKLLFDYNVRVWQNANNTIELKVFNYSTSRFESKGTKNCTTRFANHTLGWPGINLTRNNFGNLKGQYMFKVVGGQTDKHSNTYTGPKIKEKFKDPNVTFQKGTSTFIYNVTVNANICDKIELQVWNYTKNSGGWDSKGTGNYTMPLLTYQNLIWPDVNLTHDNLGEEYKGRYRFIGCNKSSDEGHIGPEIEENFDKPNVNYNGTIDKWSFDYEVEATVTMVNDNNIRLEIRNFDTGEWEPKGIPGYTITPSKNETLRWRNINLSCDYFDGLEGKYRFNGSYKTSRNFTDPTIEATFYIFTVTPPDGTNKDNFTYSVTVNATICDKIALEVWNHSSGIWTSKGTQNYTTPDVPDTLVWHNISLNDYELNPLNDAMYRFVGFCNRSFPDEKGKESPFWETGLEWDEDNISVKPERDMWNAEFTYCIRMYAERNLSVELVVYRPSKEWPPKEWLSKDIVHKEVKDYTNISNWDTICFPTKPFNESVGYSSYKFIFLRKGEYINETNISKGPYVGFAKYRYPEVKPPIGDKNTRFKYSVEINATKKGDVRLYILTPDDEPYEDDRLPGYDNPGYGTKIYFNRSHVWGTVERLGLMRYKIEFKDKEEKLGGESEVFWGPELIEEEISDFSVDPKEGTNTTWFNFNTKVTLRGKDNGTVTLQVSPDEAAGEEDWINVTNKSYENVGEPIPINFTVSIDEGEMPDKEYLISEWEKNNLIYWRIKGLITNSSINSTKYDINLTWYNSSFSPEKGWWNDTFNFSVNLSAGVDGTVELQVKCKEWKSVGNWSYNNTPNPQILGWNESVCHKSYEGNTSYRFIFKCGNATYPDDLCGGRPCDGPEVFIPLNIHLENNTVEPEEGVYYNFTDRYFRDTTNPLFNYSIEVTADKPTTLKLVLIYPCGEKHSMTKECKYNTNTTTPHQPQECSWRMIKLPSGQAGKWNHTFLYNDTRYGWKMYEKIFEGPEIIAVFENYTVDPDPYTFRDLVDVTVCVGGTKAMNVTLEAFNRWPHINDWESIGRKHYEPSGVKCLNWTIDTFKVPFEELRLRLEE